MRCFSYTDSRILLITPHGSVAYTIKDKSCGDLEKNSPGVTGDPSFRRELSTSTSSAAHASKRRKAEEDVSHEAPSYPDRRRLRRRHPVVVARTATWRLRPEARTRGLCRCDGSRSCSTTVGHGDRRLQRSELQLDDRTGPAERTGARPAVHYRLRHDHRGSGGVHHESRSP